ncbi:MAG: hypothetical protein GXO49_07960 [Chlorobi bacterium]|nr:hypothetical protein [Chlorobiota bacterium]
MKKNYISILFLLFISACVPDPKVAPPIPSEESMSFDFSFFEQSNKDDGNFLFASEKVLFWKPFIEDSILLQRNILINALQNNLEYQKEDTWLSNFSFNLDETYLTDFFGVVEVDTVFYKAFLSFDTIKQETFLDGKAYQDNKMGEWFFNKLQVEEGELVNSKMMTVLWDIVDSKHIKFTNNQAGENNLNYIYYIDSVDNEYNAYVDIYDKGNENHSIIQWNKLNKNGRIQDNLRFNNNDWHYWDNNLQDLK